MSGKKIMSSLKLGGVKSMIQLLIRHRHIYIITKTVPFFIIDYVLVTVSFIYIENASPNIYICDSPPGVRSHRYSDLRSPESLSDL